MKLYSLSSTTTNHNTVKTVARYTFWITQTSKKKSYLKTISRLTNYIAINIKYLYIGQYC